MRNSHEDTYFVQYICEAHSPDVQFERRSFEVVVIDKSFDVFLRNALRGSPLPTCHPCYPHGGLRRETGRLASGMLVGGRGRG